MTTASLRTPPLHLSESVGSFGWRNYYWNLKFSTLPKTSETDFGEVGLFKADPKEKGDDFPLSNLYAQRDNGQKNPRKGQVFSFSFLKVF